MSLVAFVIAFVTFFFGQWIFAAARASVCMRGADLLLGVCPENIERITLTAALLALVGALLVFVLSFMATLAMRLTKTEVTKRRAKSAVLLLALTVVLLTPIVYLAYTNYAVSGSLSGSAEPSALCVDVHLLPGFCELGGGRASFRVSEDDCQKSHGINGADFAASLIDKKRQEWDAVAPTKSISGGGEAVKVDGRWQCHFFIQYN